MSPNNVINKKCDLKLKKLGVNQLFLNRKQGTFEVKAFFKLAKILNSNNYDVVHSHLFIPDLFVALSQKYFNLNLNMLLLFIIIRDTILKY